jgi:hypothetical protein
MLVLEDVRDLIGQLEGAANVLGDCNDGSTDADLSERVIGPVEGKVRELRGVKPG